MPMSEKKREKSEIVGEKSVKKKPGENQGRVNVGRRREGKLRITRALNSSPIDATVDSISSGRK